MKKTIFLMMILIAFIILQNCDSFKLLSYKEWEQASDRDKIEPDIYCAGSYSSPTSHACYWKNGEQIILDNSAAASEVRSIYVFGKDVYAAGQYNAASGVYWKNGQIHYLPNAMLINSIVVKAGIVFCGGQGIGGIACFWVNDIKYQIAPATSTVWSIYVDEDLRIYAAGQSGNYGFYYDGNSIKTLEFDTSTLSIFIKNEVIYLSGFFDITYFYGRWWKNGILQNTLAAMNSPLTSIFVDNNNDIYMSGYDGTSAFFLKNNSQYALNAGYNANSIFVFDNNVYIGGNLTSGNGACYWKNNTQNQIILNSSFSQVKSIFVVR